MTGAADLLAAETLLLTVLTIVYGLWYGDIAAAARLSDPNQDADLADYVKERALLRLALRQRVIPLSVVAAVLSAVFAPVFAGVTADMARDLTQRGAPALRDYDPIRAALWVGWLLMAVLGTYLVVLGIGLARKARLYRVPARPAQPRGTSK